MVSHFLKLSKKFLTLCITLPNLIVLALLALWVKSFYLQIYNSEFYADKRNQLVERTKEESPIRGRIFDRNQIVLADNIIEYTLEANTEDLNLHCLGKVISENLKFYLNENDFTKLGFINKPEGTGWVSIKTNITYKQADQLKKLKIPGLRVSLLLMDKTESESPLSKPIEDYQECSFIKSKLYNFEFFNFKNHCVYVVGGRREEMNLSCLTPKKFKPFKEYLKLDNQQLYNLGITSIPTTKKVVVLYRSLNKEEITKIVNLENFPVAFHQHAVNKRRYPHSEALAPLVGSMGRDSKRSITGVELFHDKTLAGKPGITKTTGKPSTGEKFYETVITPTEDGQDLYLTVDADISNMAYVHLKKAVCKHFADSAYAVVLEAKTSRVLAISSYPSFNPEKINSTRLGDPCLKKTESADSAVLKAKADKSDPNSVPSFKPETAFINIKAITDEFEPGSTIKPFIVASALEKGLITPESLIDATRPLKISGRRALITDTHRLGVVTVHQAIQKSSNIAASKISLMMPHHQVYNFLSDLGFGIPSPLELPGTRKGMLPPLAKWTASDQASMSFGYGLTTTLLQLARAYTVFANDGWYIEPSLLSGNSGEVHKKRVFSSETALKVRNMLHSVTISGGTAEKAQVAGFQVGGKTGTAKKSLGKLGYGSSYRSFFVGIAPIEDPRFIIAVLVDNPKKDGYYGGTVAAPVFSAITFDALTHTTQPLISAESFAVHSSHTLP
ncbi:MAG: penicillin-binding protein 2 [Gammaproteobacteria bacterium]|nr:penicillin-binding protein 2 [Gammaproteobacteria bacterium]